MMRIVLASLLAMALVTPAVAQSDVARAGGAEFFDFKTYWAKKPEGCQPMITFKMKNPSSGEIGPIKFSMDIVDKDNGSIFARGLASMPSTELPTGQTKEIAIPGDHDITQHDCLGDMHEVAFSTIHFAVRLTATAGQDPVGVELMQDVPMKDELVPAQQ
jgi:hypothetical protein